MNYGRLTIAEVLALQPGTELIFVHPSGEQEEVRVESLEPNSRGGVDVYFDYGLEFSCPFLSHMAILDYAESNASIDGAIFLRWP